MSDFMEDLSFEQVMLIMLIGLMLLRGLDGHALNKIYNYRHKP